jgi:hypothetical protein
LCDTFLIVPDCQKIKALISPHDVSPLAAAARAPIVHCFLRTRISQNTTTPWRVAVDVPCQLFAIRTPQLQSPFLLLSSVVALLLADAPWGGIAIVHCPYRMIKVRLGLCHRRQNTTSPSTQHSMFRRIERSSKPRDVI